MVSVFYRREAVPAGPGLEITAPVLSSPGVGLGYPTGAWRPQLALPNPIGQVEKDPQAIRVRWWRARPNPTFNPLKGRSEDSEGEFIREEQEGEFICLIEREGLLRRYFPNANIEQGDVAIILNPSTFCVKDDSGNVIATPSEWDQIMELGGTGTSSSSAVLHGCDGDYQPGAGTEDRRIFTQKATIEHAKEQRSCAGTISSVGTALTGVGTAFLTDFRAGSVLVGSNGRKVRVSSVVDNTHMILETAFTPNLPAGTACIAAFDRLPYRPVVRIQSIMGESRSYTQGTDFVISPNGEEIKWMSVSGSPLPGERIGVVWDYVPTWSITDLGQKGVTVRGIPSLVVLRARLWKPGI